MKELLSNLTTGVLVLCAVLITAAVVRREFFPPPAAAAGGPSLEPRRVENARELAEGGRLLGEADAPVRIVEFSDFQCPFCARMHPRLEALRRRHPDRVAIVYRHFPLDEIHPHARTAALAAECAGEQGRFAEMTSLLFARQDSIGVKPWAGFAAEAGVRDGAAFDACLRDGRHAAAVERDAALGRATRVEVTPTLVIGGTLYPGVLDSAALERRVAEAARQR